jgi:hypothetical protein
VLAGCAVTWIIVELHRWIGHDGSLLGPHRHAATEHQKAQHECNLKHEARRHQK